MEVVMWGLGLLGTGIMTGIGYIIKSLSSQGSALALLVARVGTMDPGIVNQRLLDLETDMARVWGIYDAWKGPGAPSGVERAGAHYATTTGH
jgi:hypothetical protein